MEEVIAGVDFPIFDPNQVIFLPVDYRSLLAQLIERLHFSRSFEFPNPNNWRESFQSGLPNPQVGELYQWSKLREPLNFIWKIEVQNIAYNQFFSRDRK